MKQLMLKVENVSKQYSYGQIGITTLREELERWREKRRLGAGAHEGGKSGTFLALDRVSFDVEPGERVGIIGANGAGKSTLLKLISRITAPTEGDIWLNGRAASMLEVGTGFDSELTGRENIYMKGAIMGAGKRDVEKKINEIIAFSECGDFIETPIKRYSSGMRVKLAFAVAAFLECEIMIMDEVLAVGDAAFQQKCLKKMEEVSKAEDRTILYVSHNMNTIRRLCSRCLVLEHGKLVFDGGVDEGIALYLGAGANTEHFIDLNAMERIPGSVRVPGIVRMTAMQCTGTESNHFPMGGTMHLVFSFAASKTAENIQLRIIVKDMEARPVAMMTTEEGITLVSGETADYSLDLSLSRFAPGSYTVNPVVYQVDPLGNDVKLDVLDNIYRFEILQPPEFNNRMEWRRRSWGYFFGEPLVLRKMDP